MQKACRLLSIFFTKIDVFSIFIMLVNSHIKKGLMKKIVFLLIILLPIRVRAVSNFQITETPYTICDEKGKLLKVHFIRHNYYSVYFFNYNQNYNYNFNEYYEFHDAYYEEIARKYLWIYPVVNFKTFYNYHQQFITRYLWENMYPENTFSFCN